MRQLYRLEPARYAPHALHSSDRSFTETNCYTDVWIELLHGAGLDPTAVMGYCIAIDFEGDQFTFFKPPAHDIERLYGIEIQELTVYRPLHEHAIEQLERGCTILPEVDAWFLPDTAATSYGAEHVKTSIAIEAVDLDARTLRYFHNAGYHELRDEDFDGIFQVGEHSAGMFRMPPFTELLRIDKRRVLTDHELRTVSRELLAHHLARRPAANPIDLFAVRLAADLERLLSADEADYHAYTFATVRQLGAAFELAASHLDWLGEPAAAAACRELTDGAKMLLFKLVRAANRRRPFDVREAAAPLAASWTRAMSALDSS